MEPCGFWPNLNNSNFRFEILSHPSNTKERRTLDSSLLPVARRLIWQHGPQPSPMPIFETCFSSIARAWEQRPRVFCLLLRTSRGKPCSNGTLHQPQKTEVELELTTATTTEYSHHTPPHCRTRHFPVVGRQGPPDPGIRCGRGAASQPLAPMQRDADELLHSSFSVTTVPFTADDTPPDTAEFSPFSPRAVSAVERDSCRNPRQLEARPTSPLHPRTLSTRRLPQLQPYNTLLRPPLGSRNPPRPAP